MIYICVHTYTMSRLKIKVSLGSFSSGRIYEVMIIIDIFYSPEIFQSGNFVFLNTKLYLPVPVEIDLQLQ